MKSDASAMATHARTIRLGEASYELLLREAKRRGVAPDALADELVQVDLGGAEGDLEPALTGLAELRAGLPEIDGVSLARESCAGLEHRGRLSVVLDANGLVVLALDRRRAPTVEGLRALAGGSGPRTARTRKHGRQAALTARAHLANQAEQPRVGAAAPCRL
jgi:hypothetical protein